MAQRWRRRKTGQQAICRFPSVAERTVKPALFIILENWRRALSPAGVRLAKLHTELFLTTYPPEKVFAIRQP